MEAKISRGNTKLGTVANISLPPVKTCRRPTIMRNGKIRMAAPPCCKLCYALKSERIYEATRAMRAHNLMAYQRTPERYFASIAEQTRGMRFFRWHVAGDIVDLPYLEGMISVAESSPDTAYLCFTKRYDIVNSYGFEFPPNLTIVFSAWPGLEMDNRYNHPVAYMVPKDGTEPRMDGTEIQCPGNCETCGMCWQLPQLGRNVAFHQH